MPTIIMCAPIALRLVLGGVEAVADLLLELGEDLARQQARRDVHLDVELAQLGHERVVGDPLEHLRVRHRGVAGLVGQVELDLQPDRALLGVEARFAQHPREDVQVALDLLAVALAVLTAEDLRPDVLAHSRKVPENAINQRPTRAR